MFHSTTIIQKEEEKEKKWFVSYLSGPARRVLILHRLSPERPAAGASCAIRNQNYDQKKVEPQSI